MSGSNGGEAGAGSTPLAPIGPVVVKLGGDVLEGPALALVGAELRKVSASAVSTLVVHGGGPQATRMSERLGLTPRLVGGRRITDAATLEVMKMVVAGALNVDLVTTLRGSGVPAVGLSGTSGLVRARRRPPVVVSGGGAAPVDFGVVGDVVGFELNLLTHLLDGGWLPVIACLGLGVGPAESGQGGAEVLNINADIVASQLAAACGARALVAVTAVGGVRRDRNDPTTRIARLTVSEARAAIAAGVVQGGMIPKLEEAFAPLAAGVGAVHIVAPGEIAQALEAPGSVGTLLVAA